MTRQLPPLVTARWDAEKEMVRLTICDDTGTSATLFFALATIPKLRDGAQKIVDDVNQRVAKRTNSNYQPGSGSKQ